MRRSVPASVAISYTSREQVEVYRFSFPVAIGVPLLALFLQALLPLRIPFISRFDLPLLVTIFFAITRRNPVSGLLTGAVIGLLQDSLTHQPLGVYGISKTIVGFGASSLGVKIDVENPGSRLLMTIFFYLLHNVIYFVVARHLVGTVLEWHWGRELISGVANALLAMVLFAFLDRFKQRT
jgi:rod shape-determining protein MreD